MVDKAHVRRMQRLVSSKVEPSSRKAIREAAKQEHQDLAQLGVRLMEAIPPSIVSHQEGGKAGISLLNYLAKQPDAPVAIKIAAEAVPKTWMPTSRRDLAIVAMQSAAAATPSALAQMGIAMVDSCSPPYPMDGAIAGTAVLDVLASMPLDDSSSELLKTAHREHQAITDQGERCEHAVKTFERLITLQEQRAEITQLADGKQGGAIQETPVAVRVGGVMLARRRK